MNSVLENDPTIYVLKNVSPLVNAVLDIDQLMHIIIKVATKFTEVKSSSLLMLDEENKKLDFFMASGANPEKLKHIELTVGEGIAGWVAQEGKPLLVNNVQDDERWSVKAAKMVDSDIKSIACVPLKAGKKVIGVIEIIDKLNGEPFRKADLDILLAFSDMAGSLLEKSKRYKNIKKENIDLKKKLKSGSILIGSSVSLEQVMSEAIKVASTEATVLISGESGTGKELMAKLVHGESKRHQHEMISINCGALPESMLERELFGHEKGSFTSADSKRIGLFEAANKSTLFLDEISEMPSSMQVKFLRVLQEGTFYRLGGTALIHTDVRVIAASNRDLEKLVQKGGFREDLFYRLNVVNITLPPLRDRRDDIPVLINHFLKSTPESEHLVVLPDTMNILMNFDWPGNVRQLKNAIERAVIMGNGKEVTPCDLPVNIKDAPAPNSFLGNTPYQPISLKEGLTGFKQNLIRQTLERTKGNRTEAARVLSIERTYLSKLIKDLDI